MARASEGARHITVDGVHYRWRAVSHDAFVAISVWPDGVTGRTITARMDDGGSNGENPPGRGRRSPRTTVVTNRLVCRMIELARAAHDYDPASRGAAIAVGRLAGQIDVSDAVRADNRWW